MRLICPIHGIQPVKYISADLWENGSRLRDNTGVVSVVYEFQGRLVNAFQVSSEFASQHSVVAGPTNLPDTYPAWAELIVTVCEQCLAERIRT
jgi:hypothetical protein